VIFGAISMQWVSSIQTLEPGDLERQGHLIYSPGYIRPGDRQPGTGDGKGKM